LTGFLATALGTRDVPLARIGQPLGCDERDTLCSVTAEEQRRFDAVVHVVHEYANFVSSAEMVQSGQDVEGALFKPPINTHVSHAFYLNCRKLADFFQSKRGPGNDDIAAEDYVSGFHVPLPVSDKWRVPINKQLAHLTYYRDTDAEEIKKPVCQALYTELRDTWRKFRQHLRGSPYEAEFANQVRKRKGPYPNGTPSEFRLYNLD
jgi:hypothetical protein